MLEDREELMKYRLESAAERFDKKYSKYLSQAFQIRNNTDYSDFFVVSQSDATEQYSKALEFLGVIEEYLIGNKEK